MKNLTISLGLALAGISVSGTAYGAHQPKECANLKQGVLLITGDALQDAWKPFAEWKTQVGKPTKILTVNEISQQYEGKDIQDKIRKCVLDHADNKGVKWVILGGDSSPGGGLVPDRDSKHTVYGRMKYADIPSDSYYVSKKDWDANGDGIYGDWNNDKANIDYTHEKVVIGRIPVRSIADVKSYTDKIIGYETEFPESDYAEKMIYTCTVKASSTKLLTSWKHVGGAWSGQGQHYFSHKTPWDKETAGDYPLSPDNWVSMINKETASKLHMHGHGFLPLWALEDHKNVTSSTIDRLTNKNAYLCMTTVSCFTGQFDGAKDPSITESILRKPEGGAVMIIAPAREGVPIFHNPKTDFGLMVKVGKMDGTTSLLTSFWKHGLSKGVSAGEAFHFAKTDMIPDAQKNSGYHWCLAEINFMGDPTLDLRAKSPITPTVAMTQRGSKLNVKTNAGASRVVCVWKKGSVYLRKMTNAAGTANFILPEGEKGSYKVTVSGASLNTVSKDIMIK